ncbi:hypothetical protein H2248_001801 [Termitomyces sp. 'cryptogamus']|nr:hypothetical protein H2248_001801 [Termitomyces sp. 'cryptogamus']
MMVLCPTAIRAFRSTIITRSVRSVDATVSKASLSNLPKWKQKVAKKKEKRRLEGRKNRIDIFDEDHDHKYSAPPPKKFKKLRVKKKSRDQPVPQKGSRDTEFAGRLDTRSLSASINSKPSCTNRPNKDTILHLKSDSDTIPEPPSQTQNDDHPVTPVTSPSSRKHNQLSKPPTSSALRGNVAEDLQIFKEKDR